MNDLDRIIVNQSRIMLGIAALLTPHEEYESLMNKLTEAAMAEAKYGYRNDKKTKKAKP
jgi:hypothetical protein